MPMTNSAMTPLGTTMPAFALPDVISGRTVTSEALAPGKPTLVLFICNHCPFSRHIAPGIRQLIRGYRGRVNLIAISANDATQVPEDSPDGLRTFAKTVDWTEPFLYDETQDVARAFGAACSPECFLYDSSRKLVYRGEIDDSRPVTGLKALMAKAPTAAPIRAALDALLNGQAINANQRPGMGCNIKWRVAAAARA